VAAKTNSLPVVLIVDDDPDLRTATKLLLESEGCSAIEAMNGLEAVRIALVQLPDLILMDLNMPIMDGIEATRLLRRLDFVRMVPIVVVTGETREKRREAIEAGCNDCIEKPLSPEVFRQTLSKYVGPCFHRSKDARMFIT
jgi:CheY-like chemotaxis protein